jgi:DNA-binding protein Fis
VKDSTEAGMPGEIRKYQEILDLFDSQTVSLDLFDKEKRALLDEWISRIGDPSVISEYIQYFCEQQKIPLRNVVRHLEKILITWSLLQSKGNQSKAAQRLGVNYSTLSKKMAKYRILSQRAHRPD